MLEDPTLLRDGWVNLLGGTQTNLPPEDLPQNTCAMSGNVVTRYGRARTRPRWRRMKLEGVG